MVRCLEFGYVEGGKGREEDKKVAFDCALLASYGVVYGMVWHGVVWHSMPCWINIQNYLVYTVQSLLSLSHSVCV